ESDKKQAKPLIPPHCRREGEGGQRRHGPQAKFAGARKHVPVLHQPKQRTVDYRPAADIDKRLPKSEDPSFHHRRQTPPLQALVGTEKPMRFFGAQQAARAPMLDLLDMFLNAMEEKVVIDGWPGANHFTAKEPLQVLLHFARAWITLGRGLLQSLEANALQT